MNSFMQNNFMNLLPGAIVQQQSPFISHTAIPTAAPTAVPTAATTAAIPAEFVAIPPQFQQQIDIQRLAAAHIQFLRQQQVLQQSLNVFSNSSNRFHQQSSNLNSSAGALTEIKGQFPQERGLRSGNIVIQQANQIRCDSPFYTLSPTVTALPYSFQDGKGLLNQGSPAHLYHSVTPGLQKENLAKLSVLTTTDGDSREGSPGSDICTEIKQEILKQLKLEQEESDSGGKVPEDQKENTPKGMSQRNNRRYRQSGSPFKGGRPRRPHTGLQQDTVLQELKPTQLGAIDNHIMAYYNQNKQPENMYARKMQLRDALYAVMKGLFPYCGLYVVGSSMNGFGSSRSDMDLCLMLSQTEIDQRKEATEILRILFKSLRACDFLREIKIIKAKVPILRFVDRHSKVECDLNINNSTGIRNTHLLNAYSRADWRLNPLILFVKFWANYHNINDAKNCTLSSYSLVLMVIHFLQSGVSPPVLPSLQQLYPHKFSPTVDIRTISLSESLPKFPTTNNQSVGELFVRFLHYYAYTFDFKTEAISVRLGCTLPRSVVERQNPIVNPPSQWKCVCIEEPFNLSNTARSVFDMFIFRRVHHVFESSYNRLMITKDINSVIKRPI